MQEQEGAGYDEANDAPPRESNLPEVSDMRG